MNNEIIITGLGAVSTIVLSIRKVIFVVVASRTGGTVKDGLTSCAFPEPKNRRKGDK